MTKTTVPTAITKIIKALDEKKGINIHLLDVKEVVSYTDYMVICTATSVTHSNALMDNVEDQVRSEMKPIYRNSGKDKNWVILDYGEVVVHVFIESARLFYDLERLWGDAQSVDISRWVEG